MPAWTIHRLGPNDVPRLRALNALFARAFADDDAYAGAPPTDAYLRDVLGRAHVLALVAEDAGRLVGGLVAYVLDKLERARSEAYLYDLAVDAPYRRRGVATALIDDLRARCAALGAWVVFVQADHGDDPAVALYTKLGVREDVMHFDLLVEPPGGTRAR